MQHYQLTVTLACFKSELLRHTDQAAFGGQSLRVVPVRTRQLRLTFSAEFQSLTDYYVLSANLSATGLVSYWCMRTAIVASKYKYKGLVAEHTSDMTSEGESLPSPNMIPPLCESVVVLSVLVWQRWSVSDSD